MGKYREKLPQLPQTTATRHEKKGATTARGLPQLPHNPRNYRIKAIEG